MTAQTGELVYIKEMLCFDLLRANATSTAMSDSVSEVRYLVIVNE